MMERQWLVLILHLHFQATIKVLKTKPTTCEVEVKCLDTKSLNVSPILCELRHGVDLNPQPQEVRNKHVSRNAALPSPKL